MLNGTHGTSKTRADKILSEQRFISSKEGRGGAGIYFWYYGYSKEAAYITAEQWWHFAQSKEGSEQDCAVLDVKIDKTNANYLDLVADEYREQLIVLASKHGCTSRVDASRVIQFFIDKLEQVSQQPYTLVKLMVPMPSFKSKGDIFKLSTLLSSVPALIVRHEKHELIKEITLMDEMKG